MDKSELVVMFIRGRGECEYKTFGLLCLLICKITVILHTWEMTEAIYPFLRNNAGELQVKQRVCQRLAPFLGTENRISKVIGCFTTSLVYRSSHIKDTGKKFSSQNNFCF